MDTAPIIQTLVESERQSGIEQQPTVSLRLCRACLAEMRDHDKFCRRCGVRQTGESSAPRVNPVPLAYARSHFQADTFCRLSAPLLTGITAGAQASTLRLNSRFARRAVSVLIVIPLWLMIVLLSPFDAFVTAKAIIGQHQPPYRNFGDWPGYGRSSPRTL